MSDLIIALESLLTGQGVMWSALTLACFVLANVIYSRSGNSVWLHPVSVTVGLITPILYFSPTSLIDYRQHTALIDWLVIPATVSLAIPIFEQRHYLQRYWKRLVIPILVGAISGPTCALLILLPFAPPDELLISMSTKSITSPLAIETVKPLGGWPELAAALVIITGLIGAIVGPLLFRITQVHSPSAQGLAWGVCAHGIGTAQAFSQNRKSGVMATIGMCSNGLLTSLLLPLIVTILN